MLAAGNTFQTLPRSAIMMRPQVPNRTLRGLLAETGWTQSFLARQVSAVAAESGVAMRLDRRSVAHWLAGRRPRAPVPGLIAEALTRGLGRPVGLADIGMGPVAADRPGQDTRESGLWFLADTSRQPHAKLENSFQTQDVVVVLTSLAAFDQGRRQMLSAATYSLAALALPGWAQAASSVVGIPAASGPRLEPGQVVTAEQMTRVFSDIDTAFGGGRARAALSAYLASGIAPRLRAPGSAALRRRLFSAATELTYLAAFMCFDDERHGLAQRYYRAALELAAENNDPAAYAVTLRGLSVQARILGHPGQAVQLAETAAAIARNSTGQGRQAFFLGQVAVAAAAAGSRHDALTAISAAERRLDRASSQAAPAAAVPGSAAMGGYHPASLAHQQAAVQALLGDRKGAITALAQSIRHRPPQERRSRAITHARLAELDLDQGHLDRAIVTWQAFLDDYPYLTSGRAVTAMNILRTRLQPHRTSSAARQLLTRAARI